ncbi:hypothetical protein BMS3Bbin12_01650 [bacterium BMS3Bbin12]|nr:hypothetical protein BMS3Abin12_01386 [bacterium BMS3Abin12]GBE48472.1 hypothetical protein BMS3Bbin12_01650 [bacterium BMS3Bbin12]GBE50431.1 hypothetical protein BMS3Bbin13_01370 [bacterium BMS3Bbin13]HDJ85522.1 hypothetical protein [Chromatiales bacterium]HDO33655.1 hypothetical protein [Chromatiales bacterium]
MAESFDTATGAASRGSPMYCRACSPCPPAPVAAMRTAGLVALDLSPPAKRLIMRRVGGLPAIACVAADG